MRWRTDEAIVKHLIASSVLNAIFNKIKGKDVLKALFERPTTQDLVNLRCREDNDVREHFDKLANMREQLSTIDKSIDFDAVASIAIEHHGRFRRNEWHIRYFRYRDQAHH
jgi:hypothetical protein